MALVDNFDSYTDGDVVGQGSWTLNGQGDAAADMTVQGTVVQGGTKALVTSTVSYVQIEKTFTQIATGIQSFRFGMTATNITDLLIFNINEGTTRCMSIHMNSDGNIKYKNATVLVTIGAVTANTWHKLDIKWNNSTQYQCQLDDGGYTALDSMQNNIVTGVDRIRLGQDFCATAELAYFDTLTDTDAPDTAIVLPRPNLLLMGVG